MASEGRSRVSGGLVYRRTGPAAEGLESQPLDVNPVTLSFQSSVVEGEYMGDVAKRRWPVLLYILCFDLACFAVRMCFRVLNPSNTEGRGAPSLKDTFMEFAPQIANMTVLYIFVGLLNRRSQRSGSVAAKQEEFLLSACMATAICNLLASLGQENKSDYVYAAYFLICSSTFLKIRWWVGTFTLAAPTLAVNVWNGGRMLEALPQDAVVHIVVAWAVGGLMAYLTDWYRRQMFASQKRASFAHAKELLEAQARIRAQRQLVAAQAQAQQRALHVAREKAANEAKSEFMSLMCHEVRTPLNGCLASAEMLLETPLQEEQRELAKTIRVSGSILLSTVSNFLDFFKMEAGKQLDIVRTQVDLRELVADVHCIIEAMIGRGGDVHLKPPDLDGVPEAIMGDPDRLRGILLNLYTNAAKFTRRGHIALRVREVGADFCPPTPEGHSSVTVTPAYKPSASSSSDALGCGSASAAPAGAGPTSHSSASDSWDANGAGAGHGAGTGYVKPNRGRQSAVRSEEGQLDGDGGQEGVFDDDSFEQEKGETSFGSPPSSPGALQELMPDHTWHGWFNEKWDGFRRSIDCVRRVFNTAALPPPPDGTPPWHGRFSSELQQRGATPEDLSGMLSGRGSGLGAGPGAGPRAGAGWHGLGLALPTVMEQPGKSSREEGELSRRSAEQQRRHLSSGGGRRRASDSSPGWHGVSASGTGRGATAGGSAVIRSAWDADGIPTCLSSTGASTARSSMQLSPRSAPAAAAAGGGHAGPQRHSHDSLGSNNSYSSSEPQAAAESAGGGAAGSGAGSSKAGEVAVASRGSGRGGGAVDGSRGLWGAELSQCWLLFEVIDTGVGIAPEGLPALFKEFVQGTDDEMRKPRSRGGTGLGLSICSKQVGVLGGRIGAQSQLGQGSRFWFKIPALVSTSHRHMHSDSHESWEMAMQEAARRWAQEAPLGSEASAPGVPSTPTPPPPPAVDRTSHIFQDSPKSSNWSAGPDLPPAVSAPPPPATPWASAPASGVPDPSAPPPASPAKPARSIQPLIVPAPASEVQGSDYTTRGSAAANLPPIAAASPTRRGTTGSLQGISETATASAAATRAAGPSTGASQCGTGSGGGTGASPGQPAGGSLSAPALLSSSLSAPPPLPGAEALPSGRSSSDSTPLVVTTAGLGAGPAAGPGRGGMPRSESAPWLPTGRLDGGARKLDSSCLQGLRVLLAEDNLINQTVARKMLNSLGMMCEVASNGAEAVAAIQRCTRPAPLPGAEAVAAAAATAASAAAAAKSPSAAAPGDPSPISASTSAVPPPDGGAMFHVVLMDMAMPVMGGVDATKAIRAAGCKVPIVAMTANASGRDRDECHMAGMDGFLSKPVLKDQLAEAIMSVLQLQERSMTTGRTSTSSAD